MSTTIAGVRVRDVMYPEVGAVSPENAVSEALETMFKSRYHDALVVKDGVLLGVVTWNDIMNVKPEQRVIVQVEKLPRKQISIFDDESILEAYKIMSREKIDLVPVVKKEAPTRVVGVVTNESIGYAYEKAKTLR